MKEAWSDIRQRKFWLTVLVICICTALLLGSIIDQHVWSGTVQFTLGLYLGANVAKAGVEAYKNTKVKKDIEEEISP